MDLVWFLIVVGVIIFVHELGHFLAAKSTGMKVEKFSLGFPPKLKSFHYKGTEYSISAIPLGGYVKIAGMVDESLEKNAITGATWEFQSKKPWQKILVLCAGVIMNALLAVILFTVITKINGVPTEGPVVVGGVEAGRPAESVGLKADDVILSIDNQPIKTWQAFVDYIKTKPNQPIVLQWIRGLDTLQASAVPDSREVTVGSQTVTQGYLGVEFRPAFRSVSIFEAVKWGVSICWDVVRESLILIVKLVGGKASISELTGPIGIAKLSGESAKFGVTSFLGFIGLISISIALLNILPLPVLDGGHVLIVLIETAVRRTISTRVKLIIQQIGFALLIVLVLVVSYHDILRLIVE
jgi:regulator of sigma E protease